MVKPVLDGVPDPPALLLIVASVAASALDALLGHPAPTRDTVHDDNGTWADRKREHPAFIAPRLRTGVAPAVRTVLKTYWTVPERPQRSSVALNEP